MVRPFRFGSTTPDSDHSLRHFFPRKRETAKLDGLPFANGMAANDPRMNHAKPVLVDVRMQEAPRFVERKRKHIFRPKCFHRDPPNNRSLGNRGRMKNFRLEVSSNGERPVVIIKSSQRHTNPYATCAASTPPANPWLDISTALNCED